MSFKMAIKSDNKNQIYKFVIICFILTFWAFPLKWHSKMMNKHNDKLVHFLLYSYILIICFEMDFRNDQQIKTNLFIYFGKFLENGYPKLPNTKPSLPCFLFYSYMFDHVL